jgi:anti-anti-sigma factor
VSTGRSDPFLEESAPSNGGVEQPLSVAVRGRDSGFSELTVAGEIDFATHRILLSALVDELERGHQRIVLDLREVTFCDSTGLGVLVRVHQQAAADGGWLRLVGPTAGVRRALEITNLDRLIPIHATVADAGTD